MLTQTIAQYSATDFASEVRAGLTRPGQKELPSKYLYDEVGSALFEVICVLPEYGLARAGARLLRQHAEQIVSRLPLPVAVAELGSGTGKKTRWILEADTAVAEVTPRPRKELGRDQQLHRERRGRERGGGAGGAATESAVGKGTVRGNLDTVARGRAGAGVRPGERRGKLTDHREVHRRDQRGCLERLRRAGRGRRAS